MVTKLENILSDKLYLEVFEYLNDLEKNKSTQFTTSFTTWQKELINTSTPIIRYILDNSDSELRFKIKKEVEDKIPYFIGNIVFHLYPNLSYITWHNDKHVDASLTIYLNENWDGDWGGYLLYESNNVVTAIKPEKNLGILQENGVQHCVTSTNIGAPIRKSLQFFLHKNKKLF